MTNALEQSVGKFFQYFNLITFLTASCSMLTNKNESLGIICKVSADEVTQSHFVRFLNEQNQPLTAPESSSLKIRVAYAGLKIELPATDGGCIRVPAAENITVDVYSPTSQRSVSRSFRAGAKNSLTEVLLLPQPKLNGSLECPDEGLFANQSLKSYGHFSSNSSLANVELRIVARSQKNGQSQTLYTKPLGVDEIGSISDVSTELLEQGVYKLRIQIKDLVGSFDKSYSDLLPVECNLTILKNVSGFALNSNSKPSDVVVADVGNEIRNKAELAENGLFFCREEAPGSKVEFSSNSIDNCESKNVCGRQSNFTAAKGIIFDRPGVFKYYFFIKDRADNISPLSCQTYAILDKKPNLSVQWANDEWKSDGSSAMSHPVGILKAKIEIMTNALSKKYLENHLSCKVEFALKGASVLKGNDVRCMSGRCKGQTMEEFVPCDTDITFSVMDAWRQTAISKSQIRLIVQSEDSLGKIESKTQSVWINDSAWSLKSKEATDLQNLESTLQRRIIDQSGNLLFPLAEGEISVWKDGVSRHVPKPTDKESTQFQIVQDDRKNIFGVWNISDGQPNTRKDYLLIARWTGIQWLVLTSEANSKMRHQCTKISGKVSVGFWFHSVDLSLGTLTANNQFNYFDGKDWAISSSIITPENSCDTRSLISDFLGRSFVRCKNILFQLNNDNTWIPYRIENHENIRNFHSYRDGKAVLWAVGDDANGQVFIGRILEEIFEDLNLPPSNSKVTFDELNRSVNLLPDGVLSFGSAYFDEKKFNWSVLSGVETDIQNSLKQRLIVGNDGSKWLVYSTGIRSLDSRQDYFIPLKNYGLRCDRPDAGCSIFKDGKGDIWIQSTSETSFDFKFYRFRQNPYVYFGSDITGLPEGGQSHIVQSSGSTYFVPLYKPGPVVKLDGGLFKKTGIEIKIGGVARMNTSNTIILDGKFGITEIKQSTEVLFPLQSDKTAEGGSHSYRVGLASVPNRGDWFIWANPNQLVNIIDSKLKIFTNDKLGSMKALDVAVLGESIIIATSNSFLVFDCVGEKFEELSYQLFGIDASVPINLASLNILRDGSIAFAYENSNMKSSIFILNFFERKSRNLGSRSMNGEIGMPYSILQEISGKLVASSQQGLYELNNSIWEPLVTNEMLASEAIEGGFFGVMEDEYHRLWTSTELGLIRLDRR